MAAMASCAMAEYTDGLWLLNEDWFGHNSSTVNFYSYTDGTITYRAFQKENKGLTLGNTTQFCTQDDSNIYFCSKQNYGQTGGRFIVADAKTLQAKHSINAFDGGGDTRACLPVSSTQVFIGTTSGIYVYNPTNGEITSTPIEGTGVKEPGEMAVANGRLFVCAQGLGVYVINLNNLALEKTIEVSSSTCTLFTVGEQVWVAVNDCSWGTPSSSNTEQFIEIDTLALEAKTPVDVAMACQNSSWAWRKTSPSVDEQNKVLYYAPADGGNFVSKYDMATGQFTQEFIVLPEGESMYGNSVAFDARKGIIAVMCFEGYGNANFHFHTFNTAGELLSSIPLEENYWFPAMVMVAKESSKPTGISEVEGEKEVASVRYYDAAGHCSATPWAGLNIVLTTYTDGTHITTKKMIK